MPQHTMRPILTTVWLLTISVFLLSESGCGPGSARSRYKETTDSFVGKIEQDGKPVTLPQGARLDLVHDETYSRFGIPLNADGTFTIGWMPTGKYSAELVWLKDGTTQAGHQIPGGLTIDTNAKEYEVDLGKEWKP